MLQYLALVEPVIKTDRATLTDTYGHFEIEPLERGYGNTLGHMLKEHLLRLMEGTAVTAIKIKGQKLDDLSSCDPPIVRLVLGIKTMAVASCAKTRSAQHHRALRVMILERREQYPLWRSLSRG